MGINSRAQALRFIALAACWTLAVVCMGIGTFEMDADADPIQRTWLSWGLFFALVAEVPTGWCIVAWYAHRERTRVETIAHIAATEALRTRDQAEEGGTVLTLH